LTTLALGTPSTLPSGAPGGGAITGYTLPTAETSTSGDSGASVANNGAILVRAVCTTNGTLSFTCQKLVEGGAIAATVFQQSLTAGSYIFGPFKPSEFNDANGLLQMTGTFFGGSGNTIGAYVLPNNVSGS
jgi:hypothetical protein